jgi:hypothetical protein
MTDDGEDVNNMLNGNTRRGVLAATGTALVAGCTTNPTSGGKHTTNANTESQSEHSALITHQAKLTPKDGDAGDEFGGSVAIDGKTAVFGADRDEDPNGKYAGSAYVFSGDDGEWRQQSKLTPNDGDSGDYFGWSVAFAGETAVIGAPYDHNPNGEEAGSAYVFSRSDGEWRQDAKLTPEDGDSGDSFGWSVAVDSGTVIIGAPGDEEPNGEIAGSAYVFSTNDGAWRQHSKLAPDDGDSRDTFGKSVAVAGEMAVIGASYDVNPNGPVAGSVYVFSGSDGEWRQQAKLTPDDGDSSDRFGRSVAIDGETAVIGADRDEDPNGPVAGSAYVFFRGDSEWNQKAKLTPDDGDSGDHFGQSVAINGERVVIGASYDKDPNGEEAGSAYAFSESDGEWRLQSKLTASDGDTEDFFGTSVAVTSKTTVVGARYEEDPNGEQAGSVYVF